MDEIKPLTAFLILVVIFLVWQMVCKQGKDHFDVFDYDYNYMDAAGCGTDLYNLTNTTPAMSMAYGYRGDLTAGLPGVSQRSDWMTNRFSTSSKDNFIAGGMNGDSITSPGALMAGPVYTKNDPRDIIGQANSALTAVPYQSTQELQCLLPYGMDAY